VKLLEVSLSVLIACVVLVGEASPSSAKGALSGLAKLPKKLLVVTVGTAVGTPVALVRCTKREVVNKTKEAFDLGGVPKPLGYLTAGFFGIPSGILSGAATGALDGVLDSVANSSDEPFNKGSVSMDKLVF